MHVLLLNPPFLSQYGKFCRGSRSPAIAKSGTLYYPMWLAYAAGVLEKQGFQTTLLDCPADRLPWRHVETLVKEQKPSLVIIDTTTPSIYSDIQQGEIIKAIHPEAFVVLVGPHVSALPEQALDTGQTIDAVAIQEYEPRLCGRLGRRGQKRVLGVGLPGQNSRRTPFEDPNPHMTTW
jgi:radical SAM superfamily enzyme YgiQ (UPF0313 family)